MLVKGEPFAFTRCSDGELLILQNKELMFGPGVIKIGDAITGSPYKPEEFKHFDPSKHGFHRDRLIDAFKFKKHNYFKGICCRCCTSSEDYKWQLELMEETPDYEFLTWANLFVNSNYSNFIQYYLPAFYSKRVVMVCNKSAKFDRLPFVVKHFPIGQNAMVNDYGLIETIKKWIKDNKISDHVFLCSAASFSELIVHQLYDFCDRNIYMDIGTTLSPLLGLHCDRSYLRGYWYGSQEQDINKVCIW